MTRDTAAMFLCTSYPIKMFKQPVQQVDCLHVYSSLYFIVSFMKNNTFSIFLLILLLMLLIIIQLLMTLLCYTLAYCMHSYTSCSSEQTVSSLTENKVRQQFMMKKHNRLISLLKSGLRSTVNDFFYFFLPICKNLRRKLGLFLQRFLIFIDNAP